ncbi:hypothetical protein VSH64_00340 [Amycolatopsis rhabdoformis]|uniref:Uncharacterized protein n=1 Tax=Amycolatopsis rhabdoformis TaxID=1448059 RepID=A0ABZ1I8S8_9PSEU|nr:hypothetical protein [Amycolatopsis rhabdoformis]WSE30594.1 hypothetical protein VSH64_00340 [Amycolatopsis rhabdoformis]
MTLSLLAHELTAVIDDVAATFGPDAVPTVDGELDCDPAHPGTLVCWQYGVRLDHRGDAEHRLAESVLPSLEAAGWQVHDRSTPRELIARFSREGADFTVHVTRAGGGVAVIGSTRCVAPA